MYLELLALGTCTLWAMDIAYRDLLTYRISNLSLLMGLALVWPSLLLLDQKFQFTAGVFVTAVVALVAGITSSAGMGDVKLILFLAPWLNYENMSKGLFILIGVSWLQLIVISLKRRGFPKRIAFAPAILLAAALNMAT